MFSLAVVAVCLATACLGNPLPDEKIVGGATVSIEQYPYQLSLQFNGFHNCGATIISANWALTAAHCTKGSIAYMTVRAGSSIRGSGGTVHQVSQKIVHIKYNPNTHDYDIALIQVTTPFEYGVGVSPAVLPDQDEQVVPGTNASVSGWGAISEGGSLPSMLQAVIVPVVSQEECKLSYGLSITNSMICAGYTDGQMDSCQGDSGGPLIADDKLIGLVSWGYGCARPTYPGVYARVAFLRNWIKTNSGV